MAAPKLWPTVAPIYRANLKEDIESTDHSLYSLDYRASGAMGHIFDTTTFNDYTLSKR